ncbi:MAG: cytochrome c [Desulfuromonas sp.]|nr:MAG: cytochrome c [Desulfuromonas sp.]
MKKRDIALIIGGIAIVLFLLAAPEETTKKVPTDTTHQKYYDLVKQEGKKAAEKFCEDCHNDEQVTFPPDHPPKARCLFCHKLEQ